jgi:TonB family protein
MAFASSVDPRYQQPMFGWDRMDPILKKCLTGSSIVGLLAIIVILVAPALPEKPKTLDNVSERIARLIIEKPKPIPAAKTPERVATAEPPKGIEEEKPIEQPKPKAQPRREAQQPKVTQDRGIQGRQKAQKEVAQNVAQVTGSLDKVMANISKSLPASNQQVASSSSSNARARRSRSVRGGRSSEQLGSVGGIASVSGADVSGSAIENEGISIAAITDLAVDGGGGGTGTGEGGGVPDGTAGGTGNASSYRSNESLLNVVRRYAPGIQFCYDNELKKNSSLRGKIVVAITVLANGQVSEATVVENTLGSKSVSDCVLAQIHGWRFPAIPYGVTSFRAPFVFTPPN